MEMCSIRSKRNIKSFSSEKFLKLIRKVVLINLCVYRDLNWYQSLRLETRSKLKLKLRS